MALDIYLVEDVHASLLVRYGDAWARKYEHIEDIELVRRDWAEVLDGLSKEACWHALKNLPPTFPPNATEFRALAKTFNAPKKAVPQLEAPRYRDPQKWRAAFERLGELFRGRRPLTWAYDLQEREKRGDTLLESQRIAWRRALESRAADVHENGTFGAFTPIPDHMLPPGMREESNEL